MPSPPHIDSQTANFNFRGGEGGSGGPGHGQGTGGSGGPGEGPRLDHWTLNSEQLNMNINMGMRDSSTSEAMDRDTVIQWYSPLNFFLRQEDIFSAHQQGTGEWFLRNEIFMRWKSRRANVLWCHGMPGAGKTVLCSLVVHHLRNDPVDHTVGIAAIYLNHKESDAHSPSMLLAALWRQLVFKKSISVVQELYKKHRELGTRPSMEDGLNVLRAIISQYSKVFIVVDALDEYPDHQRDVLLEQLSLLVPSVNLMLASRPHIEIDHRIPDFTAVEIRATAEDIGVYLRAKIQASPRISRHLRTSPDLQEVIEEKLLQGNDGMFLLAKLYIDSLLAKPTIKSVREALATIPTDLDNAYDEVVHRIKNQSEDDRKLAWLTLSWITNAKRPLGYIELLEALAVKPGDRIFDRENLMDAETVLSVCAGLVVINRDDLTIRLIHYTIQTYLEPIQSQEFPDAPLRITTTCLTYLSFPLTFDSRHDPHNSSWNHPFIGYAREYWMEHARGTLELRLKPVILSFLTRDREWLQPRIPLSLRRLPTGPLWVAAAFNLNEIYHHLLDIFSRDLSVRMNEGLSVILQHLRIVLHDPKPRSMELLALSETDAQVLVDLLQTLLDHDAFLMIRPSLFNALLQLCRAYRLFPTCFALSGLQLDRYPIAIRGLGDVGKGWVCGQSVAVKMTKTFIYEDFSIEPFGNEVLIWRQLCHPNILPFFGLSYRYSRRCLVLPWMKNGAIWGHLRDDSPGIDARISLILGVALGVEYLHRNGVVHANLKGSNILVTPSHRACIIDFGSSSMVDARIRGSSPSQGGAMPLRWQAPELLKGANSNLGSDVYAFGCVCYEVLTGHIPFYDLRHDGVVIMAVARGRRPTRLQSCTGTPVLDNLWDLIQDCWEQNPDKRPTASQIVERLVGPLIQATTTQSTTDWDKKLTARFRRSLQAQTLQPAINEIARELLGDVEIDLE